MDRDEARLAGSCLTTPGVVSVAWAEQRTLNIILPAVLWLVRIFGCWKCLAKREGEKEKDDDDEEEVKLVRSGIEQPGRRPHLYTRSHRETHHGSRHSWR